MRQRDQSGKLVNSAVRLTAPPLPFRDDWRQAGLIFFPPGEIANVLLPPSDLPVALETAVLTVSMPPFGNDCPRARFTVTVLFDVS